jgi:hypothetical protein
MLYFCDEILRSGSVRWSWPGSVTPIRASDVAAFARLGPLPRLNINGQSAGVGQVPLMGHAIELPGQVMMDITDAMVVNLAELVALAKTQPGWRPAWLQLAPDERTSCRFYITEVHDRKDTAEPGSHPS